jgi:hypothetical protein
MELDFVCKPPKMLSHPFSVVNTMENKMRYFKQKSYKFHSIVLHCNLIAELFAILKRHCAYLMVKRLRRCDDSNRLRRRITETRFGVGNRRSEKVNVGFRQLDLNRYIRLYSQRRQNWSRCSR